MEQQVSRLIDAMQGLSPEGSRIWSEMVAAEYLSNLIELFMFPVIPVVLIYYAVYFFKQYKKDTRSGEGWFFLMSGFAILGVIFFIICVADIPGTIAAILHPEAAVANDIIKIMKSS